MGRAGGSVWRGGTARGLRYGLIAGPYRAALNYQDSSLQAAGSGIERRDALCAALATYRHAITELTRRNGALAVKREVLPTQLHDAANGNTPAALTEPRRHRRP